MKCVIIVIYTIIGKQSTETDGGYIMNINHQLAGVFGPATICFYYFNVTGNTARGTPGNIQCV